MSVRRKSAPQSGAAPFPPRGEWLFREADVPDGELAACVCWEYLREISPGDLGEGGLADYTLKLLTAYRADPHRRKFADSHHRTPLRVLAFLADHPSTEHPLPPWQELGPSARRELSQEQLRAWGPLVKVDAVHTGPRSWGLDLRPPEGITEPRTWQEQAPEAHAFAVAYMAHHHSTGDLPPAPRVGAAVRRAENFERILARPGDPQQWLLLFAANGFAAPAPFLINWAEYDVKEIIRAFAEWAQASQPGLAPGQRQQGTSLSDLRAHLRDLGALRLMKVMTEDRLKRADEEYDLFRATLRRRRDAKALPNLDLTKLRSQAVKHFQLLFALSPGQKPRSWQPRRPRGRNAHG